MPAPVLTLLPPGTDPPCQRGHALRCLRHCHGPPCVTHILLGPRPGSHGACTILPTLDPGWATPLGCLSTPLGLGPQSSHPRPLRPRPQLMHPLISMLPVSTTGMATPSTLASRVMALCHMSLHRANCRGTAIPWPTATPHCSAHVPLLYALTSRPRLRPHRGHVTHHNTAVHGPRTTPSVHTVIHGPTTHRPQPSPTWPCPTASPHPRPTSWLRLYPILTCPDASRCTLVPY